MNKTCVYIFLLCFRLSSAAQEKSDTSFNFYFETNSFQLDSIQLLKLRGCSSLKTIKKITGYTDTTGSKAYNLLLSKKRASAVFNALQTEVHRFNQEIVIFGGESLEEPALWMNRRVQIISEVGSRHQLKNTAGENVSDTLTTFYLENVYFVPDQSIITYESLAYIQELAKILARYKMENFEINGHINYQSRFDSSHLTDLYRLSELRARAVYDNLIELGISKERLKYRGVGNSKPAFSSPINDEQRRKNMRVQIIIRN